MSVTIARYMGGLTRLSVESRQSVPPTSDISKRPPVQARGLWAVGYGSDDSPAYCRAAAGRAMRQGNGLISLIPPRVVACPEGTGPGQAVIRQVFGAAPSHLHSTNSDRWDQQ